MSKELETYNEFLDIIEFPVKSHLLNSNDKPTLERYRVLRTQIETTLEDYQTLKREYDLGVEHYNELLNDYNKEHKTLEIIIEKEVNVQEFKSCLEVGWDYELCEKHCQDNDEWNENPPYRHSMKKEEFDLLKEVLQ